ncbi:uncharacterized protein [Nicotiana sylvestris]|uniref:uncharacterized protein n=1 Tax=Nicotiana sylvestris TaxID=4096 RepID=UPI00388C817A
MFFYLTTLSLQKFIKEDVLVLADETQETECFLVIEAWRHSDFLWKNYIISGLEDALYNVYSDMETSKELWTTLEKKYKIEDAGLKKFIAAEFLDYKMVDSKSVITQVQELQVTIHDLLAEATMIEKFPPLWKDFKNYLKHKRKKMTLEDLIRSFSTYDPVGPNETISMGNAAKAKIEGCGKIFLKMTSGKVVTLNNVLYVPEIRKNLASTGLLVKNGFKCVFVSDKVVISKNEMFVGKGYLTEGLFKLNLGGARQAFACGVAEIEGGEDLCKILQV